MHTYRGLSEDLAGTSIWNLILESEDIYKYIHIYLQLYYTDEINYIHIKGHKRIILQKNVRK